MPTILVTGFGPFPGAPFNPTIELVHGLARLRRPALADVKIAGHVFTTSYASVDRDLPALIARHKPDAVLMFGLAARAKAIRVETRARNALALLPDASGTALRRIVIAGDEPATRAMPAPHRQLLAAALSARVPAHLSRDAGRYLCNYACWRAVQAVGHANGPRLAAFVHVPLPRQKSRPRSAKERKKELNSGFRGNDRRLTRRRSFTSADLLRAGTRVLIEVASALRR